MFAMKNRLVLLIVLVAAVALAQFPKGGKKWLMVQGAVPGCRGLVQNPNSKCWNQMCSIHNNRVRMSNSAGVVADFGDVNNLYLPARPGKYWLSKTCMGSGPRSRASTCQGKQFAVQAETAGPVGKTSIKSVAIRLPDTCGGFVLRIDTHGTLYANCQPMSVKSIWARWRLSRRCIKESTQKFVNGHITYNIKTINVCSCDSALWVKTSQRGMTHKPEIRLNTPSCNYESPLGEAPHGLCAAKFNRNLRNTNRMATPSIVKVHQWDDFFSCRLAPNRCDNSPYKGPPVGGAPWLSAKRPCPPLRCKAVKCTPVRCPKIRPAPCPKCPTCRGSRNGGGGSGTRSVVITGNVRKQGGGSVGSGSVTCQIGGASRSVRTNASGYFRVLMPRGGSGFCTASCRRNYFASQRKMVNARRNMALTFRLARRRRRTSPPPPPPPSTNWWDLPIGGGGGGQQVGDAGSVKGMPDWLGGNTQQTSNAGWLWQQNKEKAEESPVAQEPNDHVEDIINNEEEDGVSDSLMQ